MISPAPKAVVTNVRGPNTGFSKKANFWPTVMGPFWTLMGRCPKLNGSTTVGWTAGSDCWDSVLVCGVFVFSSPCAWAFVWLLARVDAALHKSSAGLVDCSTRAECSGALGWREI